MTAASSPVCPLDLTMIALQSWHGHYERTCVTLREHEIYHDGRDTSYETTIKDAATAVTAFTNLITAYNGYPEHRSFITARVDNLILIRVFSGEDNFLTALSAAHDEVLSPINTHKNTTAALQALLRTSGSNCESSRLTYIRHEQEADRRRHVRATGDHGFLEALARAYEEYGNHPEHSPVIVARVTRLKTLGYGNDAFRAELRTPLAIEAPRDRDLTATSVFDGGAIEAAVAVVTG